MYNVAFVYTAATRGYKGVITWSTFESKGAFDAWYTDDIKQTQQVVEEGVSEERCIELVRQTPPVCYAAAALEKATNRVTGEIDRQILEMELAAAMTAVLLRL